MVPTFIKSYEASATVAGNRFVKFSDAANSSKVAQGAASTDPLIGLSDRLGADAGGMLDVVRAGLGQVQLGGTVNAGDPLTSDDEGKVVKATAADDTVLSVGAYADQPGVEGDIIDCWIARSALSKPNAAA